MSSCIDCRRRGPWTNLREPSALDESFDPTLGLENIGRGLFACGQCAVFYLRTVDRASLFHDYDEYRFDKVTEVRDADVYAPNDLPIPIGLWRELAEQYQHPRRYYHTFDHVLRLVQSFEALDRDGAWQHPREVYLAMLFHDAVYEPGRRDNERQSAVLARQRIDEWLADCAIDVELVARLIELTASHGRLDAVGLTRAEACFLDCDMAILAAPWPEFLAYDIQVEAEYRSVISGDDYRQGRAAFLRGLLANSRIFLSEPFRVREAPARANLERALEGPSD